MLSRERYACILGHRFLEVNQGILSTGLTEREGYALMGWIQAM